jgi:hypothetical protein
MNRAASISRAPDRAFRIDVAGGDKDGLLLCDGKCSNARPFEQAIHDGDGKVMYDDVARTFGYDPKTVRQDPEAHAKVMGRLSRTIDAVITNYKENPRTPSGIASAQNSFRAAAAQVARAEEQLETAGLNLKSAQAIANLPGASLLANGQVRGVVQTGVKVEMAVLGVVRPELKQAATSAIAVGTIGTIALGELTAPETMPEVKPEARSQEKNAAQEQVKVATLGLDEVQERKRDDSCAPDGGIGEWVVVIRPQMSESALDYQRQVALTPRLPGKLLVEYEVTSATGQSATLDGCAIWSPRKEGLEAKYGHDGLLEASIKSKSENFDVPKKLKDEAKLQARAMEDHPIDWHHSSNKPETVAVFQDAVTAGIREGGNMGLVHTPEPPK